MTENTTQNTVNAAQNAPSIQINAQYIKDLSFEAPALPQILTEITKAPEISINIDVKVSKEETANMFTVELNVKAAAQTADTHKAIFICELTYGGLVTLNAPAEYIEPLLLVEVPHLLFPSARAIVSNITREAGLPPVLINPIDFAGLYRQKLESDAAQAADQK